MESATSLLLKEISIPKTLSKFTSAVISSDKDLKAVPLTQLMSSNEEGAIKQRKTA